MTEPVDWRDDGSPWSARFGDRYHADAEHGLTQARQVFLGGCGLPATWAGARQWCVLETGFGLGLNFLVTWAAWRADAQRPAQLHYVACEAHPVAGDDLLRACPPEPALQALVHELSQQWGGLLPGVHRLTFEQGRVLLTLCVGDAQALLRQQQPRADSVYLDGFAPALNPRMWSVHTLKALARCCRSGTRAATWCVAREVRDALAQCGFSVHKVAGAPPKRDALQAEYAPRWQPRRGAPALADVAWPGSAERRALVVGAGLAGAAVAHSLARRGWRVTVLDAADHPAAGASALVAGVLAPHVSPDDSPLSRLSRAGVRATLGALAQLLPGRRGLDWDDAGVLEHGVAAPLRLAWSEGEGMAWSAPASAAQKAACALHPDVSACWHARAGWVRPRALIGALLAHDAITWRAGAAVGALAQGGVGGAGPRWRALDAAGAPLAAADLVVVCAGAASAALLPRRWPLQSLRGQIAWGLHVDLPPGLPWPVHAVNGHGNLVPRVALEQGAGWVLGSTFERDVGTLPVSGEDVGVGLRANAQRLSALCPALGAALAPELIAAAAAPCPGAGVVRTWAGVRCAAPDHLPIVGPVDQQRRPGLWACTALGARGLTWALLCAELLAARLAAEPLALDVPLARALGSERLNLKTAVDRLRSPGGDCEH